jgi:hypothetical protein
MTEPVAWRWRLPDEDRWQFTDGPERPNLGLPKSTEAKAIKEPVFAASALAAVVKERDEAIKRGDHWKADGCAWEDRAKAAEARAEKAEKERDEALATMKVL